MKKLRDKYDRLDGNTKIDIWFWSFAAATALIILMLLL